MNLAAKEPIVTSPTDDGLPEGWILTTLGKAFQLNPPKPSVTQLPTNSPVSFVPMHAVDANTGVIAISLQRPFGEVRSGFTSFANDDVIMAKITPCMENGKAAIARDLVSGFGFGSTEFHVLRSNGTTLPEYGYYFIRQAAFRSLAESEMTGSVGQKRVPADFLRQAMFPLPSLAEQRRIVAKLEEILAAASTTRARLARVPILLKRFRQSVLAAACSGRLTADWREQNPDVEPAVHLLERILAERRAKWEAEQIVKRRGRAKVSGDDLLFTKEELNARGPLTFNERVLGSENEDFQPFSRAAGGVVSGYKGPSAPDVSDLTELPGNWDWITVDQIADVGSGATPLRKNIAYYENGNIPWITSGALNDLFVSSAEEYITALALKETNVKILPVGTLLIAMYGEGKTRGKVSELAIDATTNQACASLSFHKTGHLCKPFAKLFFEKNYLDIRLMSAGGVQPNLNLSIIKDTILPLPPLPEQQEIVRRVERLFHLVDIIEKRTDAASLRADRLTQAILAKAFRGELVPTEAELARAEGRDYEPASVLLERVLTDRKTKEPVATPREVTLQERF